MKKIPVIMDCDTGGDDAAAIALVCASENFDLLGVTTVMGNLPLGQTYRNTRQLMHYLRRCDVPVLKGSDKPLMREYWVGTETDILLPIEGIESGMVPEQEWDAVTWLADALCKSEKKVTLISLAPLTNIAKLMLFYPDVAREKIDQIVLMGGGMYFGNTSGAAELNIYADPEAAKVVFGFDVPVVMCGTDVCYKGYITKDENEEIRAIGTRQSKTFAACFDESYLWVQSVGSNPDGLDMDQVIVFDSIPVVYLLYPQLFSGVCAGIEIECGSELCDGMTVCEPINEQNRYWSAAAKMHRVILDVDRDGYVNAVKEILKER